VAFDPYSVPHLCESAELAALLAPLSPRQRRVLREYVWKVELGEQGVTEWLRSTACPVSERNWYKAGDRAGYLHNLAFKLALAKYIEAGLDWQAGEDKKEIGKAQRSLIRAAPAAADRIVDIAQIDPSLFYKAGERWTEDPPATAEILDEKKVLDQFGLPHTMYLVRQVCIDVDRLLDPRYARHVKKIVDSPKSGIAIEFHDSLKAAESVLDRADKATASKAAGDTSELDNAANALDAKLAALAARLGAPAGPGEPEPG
jgi:hypothetical protein